MILFPSRSLLPAVITSKTHLTSGLLGSPRFHISLTLCSRQGRREGSGRLPQESPSPSTGPPIFTFHTSSASSEDARRRKPPVRVLTPGLDMAESPHLSPAPQPTVERDGGTIESEGAQGPGFRAWSWAGPCWGGGTWKRHGLRAAPGLWGALRGTLGCGPSSCPLCFLTTGRPAACCTPTPVLRCCLATRPGATGPLDMD